MVMFRWLRHAGVLLALVLSPTAFAASPTVEPNPAALLERMQNAAQTLSFSGIFVHQQDSILHTSRITQVRDAKQSYTRVQALEGHQHEVLKTPGETRIYLPERQMIKVDKTGQPRAAFPSMLVGSAATVLRNYEVMRGDTMRIANLDAQEYVFKPKHDSRWSVRVWVDKRTSLIVKCQKLDAQGNAVEQAAFTELNLARAQAPAASVMPAAAKSWAQHDATMQPNPGLAPLKYKADTLKGFELVGAYERQSDGLMRRYVFSDGVALVSVFVQPKPSSHPVLDRAKRRGAMAVVSREIQEAWVTVIGDVPPEAMQQFAQSIEWK